MKIVRGLNSFNNDKPIGSVALGYFDGVHLGHQEIIRTTVSKARDQLLPSAVLSFEPHPLKIIHPPIAPKLLTSFRCKAALLKQMGVDIFIVCPFTPSLEKMTALDFSVNILKQTINIKHVTVGYNYLFGHEAKGTPRNLALWGQELGFDVTVLPAVEVQGKIVSSSAIRKAIVHGEMAEAALALGRWPNIFGPVTRGAGRGRTLGFPTANIFLRQGLLWPKFGVYAVGCRREEKYLYGVANVGRVPSFSNNRARLEVNFFDFNQSLYGEKLSIDLIEFIRPEQRFDNPMDLRNQMVQDKIQALKVFEAL